MTRAARRRFQALVALVAALALFATACDDGSSSEVGQPRALTAQRAAFAPGPYSPSELDKDIAALAGWGVATYADDQATEPIVDVKGPAAPLTLLRSQVEVMGAEAAAGVGTLGSDLDAVFTTAAGTEVQMSALLAAYLQGDSTMASGLRGSLTGVDLAHPADAVFPTIALVGFIRDVGTAPPTASDGSTASTAAFVQTALARSRLAGGVCTATSTWVEGMLAALFDGLRIPAVDTSNWADVFKPLGWLLNQLISVYDAIRQGAQYVVIQGIKVLVEPIRAVLAQIALIAGVVQAALTAIHPLTSTWDGPGFPEFGVDGGEQPRYETTIHVRSTNPLVWPPALVDCAAAAGVKLPEPTLAGSRVSWAVASDEPGVVVPLSADPALLAEGEAGKATYRFGTPSEPREWKEKGAARAVRTVVTATVERKTKEVKDAADAAVDAALDRLLAFLPEFLKARARGLVLQTIDPALQQLVIRSDYRSAHTFGVTRHAKPDETPSPTPTPSPPPPTPLWVHVEREGIPGAVKAGRVVDLLACDGLAGTWRGKLRTGGLHTADGFDVPWADIPVKPFRIGNGGIGTASTTASGQVYVPLPGQYVPVRYNLLVTVDGKTMTIDGVPVASNVKLRNIPIRTAPKGACGTGSPLSPVAGESPVGESPVGVDQGEDGPLEDIGTGSGVGERICAIITAGEIGDVLGRQVGEGTPAGPLNSACSWDLPGDGLVMVQVTPPDFWSSFEDPNDPEHRKLDGIGDEAFVQPSLVAGWTAAALFDDRMVLADVSGPPASPDVAVALLELAVDQLNR